MWFQNMIEEELNHRKLQKKVLADREFAKLAIEVNEYFPELGRLLVGVSISKGIFIDKVIG